MTQDEDIDFPSKFEQLKNSFFTLGVRFYYLKASCYDDVDELELDPEEMNLVMYDLKTKQVLSAELEELNPFNLKRQLYNMKVGLGKKIKLTRFESFLSSRDCSGSDKAASDDTDL